MEKFYSTVKKACEATLEIEKCISDETVLCHYLNKVDKQFYSSYLNSPADGPVVLLRKEIANYLLHNNIDVDTLRCIIKKHKTEKPRQLKSWINPYKILHPFVNTVFREISDEVETLTNLIKDKFGDVKKSNSNGFNGAQQQGSSIYSTKIFNKTRKNQSESNQFFFDFLNGQLQYGFHNYKNQKDLTVIFQSNNRDFNFDELFAYIEKYKSLVLDDLKAYETIDYENQLVEFITDFENFYNFSQEKNSKIIFEKTINSLQSKFHLIDVEEIKKYFFENEEDVISICEGVL